MAPSVSDRWQESSRTRGIVGSALAVPAVVHVHTDLSTGGQSLDDVATSAERLGLGAVLLAENYLLRIEYGLPPFRALTRVSREERGVLDGGITRYLRAVDEVRQRHPRLLIVPGVEVIPHYFWTGSPFGLRMTMHNVQKNLLVFGLPDAATWAALPVIGNRPPGHYAAQSVVDALPVLLLVPGVVLLTRTRRVRRRLQRGVVVMHRRRWLSGGALVALAVITLVRGWPFTVDRYPSSADFGMRPYQTLIDWVNRHGGVTLWSFPEAPDFGEQGVGPVTVTWETVPYADDLLRTFRYTSFGGLYEQPARFVEPGGGWDRLLREATASERSRPAWAIGESGFHAASAGKRLGAVRTVFLVRERSEAGLLEAYRAGRMYAALRLGGAALALDEWRVVAEGATAGPGETLRVAEGAPLEVRVAVSASDQGERPVRVLLVKDGTVLAAWSGTTPFHATYRDIAGARPGYYRIDVRGPAPLRTLGNPVFVARP